MHYLQLLHSITEASNAALKRYAQMFANVPLEPGQLEKMVAATEKLLLRDDRIIWSLRFQRVSLLMKAARKDPRYADAAKKELASLAARAKVTPAAIETMAGSVTTKNFAERVSHYITQKNIPEIQQVQFTTQSPDKILIELEKAENAYKERAGIKRFLSPGKDEEIIMEFPDGFAWFDLHKPYCPKEGRAMNHCGNSAGKRNDATILSLRQKVDHKGRVMWMPHATFILDDEGVLGEMKGYDNEKPDPEFHPYIIALLKHDMISGIKGGGYLASHNFSLDDLESNEDRDALINEKPSLLTTRELIAKFGKQHPVVRSRISSLRRQLQDVGLHAPDFSINEDDSVTVYQFLALEDIFDDNDDPILKNMINFGSGVTNEMAPEYISVEQHYRVMMQMPDRYFEQICSMLHVPPGRDRQRRQDAAYLLHRQIPEQLQRAYERAYSESMDNGQLTKAVSDRVKEYADKVGFYFQDGVYTEIEEKFPYWKSSVELRLSMDDILDYVDSARSQGEDEEYPGANYYNVQEHGWAHISNDNMQNMMMQRFNEGLITIPDPEAVERLKRQGWAYHDDFKKAEDVMMPKFLSEFALNIPLTVQYIMKALNQYEAVDSDLRELRRRAGIQKTS